MDDAAIPPHYAYVIRLLLVMVRDGELPDVAMVDVEPSFGHVARIVYRDGHVRMVRGGRTGINPHGATVIARDKGYTKYFLCRLGYETPDWHTFAMPDYAARINDNLDPSRQQLDTSFAPMLAAADDLGFPCFVKPNDASQGKGVYRCRSRADVEAALQANQKIGSEVVLIEAESPYPDYRVVVYRDRIIAAYYRAPLSIVGDGRRPVSAILTETRQQQHVAGRKIVWSSDDPRILRQLYELGHTPDTVLAEGDALPIYAIANLSLGGALRDVTGELHPAWAERCIAMTQQMGLHLCGVDLTCADITQPDAPYYVLELNAAPGLENFASLGDAARQRVHALYHQIFRDRLLLEG